MDEPPGEDWRCPGCGKTWNEIPLGHSWAIGLIAPDSSVIETDDLAGRCVDIEPVNPEEFLAMRTARPPE